VALTKLDAWRRAAIAAAIFMTLDQVTKQIAIATIERGDSRNVFFGIDLTNVRNTGVAFGAFAGGGALVSGLTLAALTLLTVYFALRAPTPWLWLPVGIIAGGALGNLADRARDGAVIDFIDPVLWPAFNLADMGIVLGILGLLYVVDKR
jgi:signal peptidase II